MGGGPCCQPSDVTVRDRNDLTFRDDELGEISRKVDGFNWPGSWAGQNVGDLSLFQAICTCINLKERRGMFNK